MLSKVRKEYEENEKIKQYHENLFKEIVGEVLKETKCSCCNTHLAPTIYQKDGVRRYLLGGALIIEAPEDEDGVKIIECWEEGDSRGYIPVYYWIHRHLDSHFVPHHKRAEAYSNIFMALRAPFMDYL